MSGVNYIAIVALGVWVPVIFLLFALLPSRRAVAWSFVFGYLFLPEASFTFHTLPDINKVSLTALGVLMASFVFDGGRLLMVRPRLIDLAGVVLCLSPIATSLSNGLGFMDGLSSSVNRLFTWGFAYWIGRAYFTDWEAVRELAMGIILGALLYVPLCWWEIRMSPQLHGEIYGRTFNSFRTDSSLFGYRPNVFLANGLTVTMYMGISSVLAFWAWMTGSPKKLFGLPMGSIVLTLIGTTVFCKALGGLVLMTSGMAILMMTRWPKTKIPMLCLLMAAPMYAIVRTSGDWSGQRLVEGAAMISEVRAASLKFRLDNEDMLTRKAMGRPWLGWGGWNRSHVFDPDSGRDLTITDGLWIIMLGSFGIIGLGSLMAMVLGPPLMIWRRIPTRFWSDPACTAVVALSVVLGLYMIDGLFNATFNPVASLAAGAVASLGATAAATFSRKPRRVVRAQPVTTISSIRDLPYAYTARRT